jgi:hypothetical protein
MNSSNASTRPDDIAPTHESRNELIGTPSPPKTAGTDHAPTIQRSPYCDNPIPLN